MRLVLRGAKLLDKGVFYRSDVVIEDDKIVGVTRRYTGPFDEELRLDNKILIPGMFDPFVEIEETYDLEELPKSGITNALIYVPGTRDEFLKISREILSRSLIDLGFRSSDPFLAPWEVFGYIIESEESARKLRYAYGPSYVAIRGSLKGERELIEIALRYHHKPFLVRPRRFFGKRACLVLSIEDAISGRPSSMERVRGIFRRRHRGYAITFGRYKNVSAPLIFTLILKGLTSRRFFDRLTTSLRLLGFHSGISPGSRANLVALTRETRESHGMKMLFRTYATIVGGEIVYLDEEIVSKPRVSIIKARRPSGYA